MIHTQATYQEKVEMNTISTLAKLGAEMGDLLHKSQSERGLSAGYIGSKGQKFASELEQNKMEFDQLLAVLKAEISHFDFRVVSVELDEHLQGVLNHVQEVEAIRKKVKELELSLPEAIAYYSKLNYLLLGTIEYLTHVSNNAEMTEQIVAYISFLESKECAGIERAVLTATFAADQFSPGMYRKFVSLVSAQESYMHLFEVIASHENIEFYEHTMQGSLLSEIDSIYKTVHARQATGGFGIEPDVWFTTITKKN